MGTQNLGLWMKMKRPKTCEAVCLGLPAVTFLALSLCSSKSQTTWGVGASSLPQGCPAGPLPPSSTHTHMIMGPPTQVFFFSKALSHLPDLPGMGGWAGGAPIARCQNAISPSRFQYDSGEKGHGGG